MGKKADYPFEVRPLSAEEGGGFLISYPDFSVCLSDGGTVEGAARLAMMGDQSQSMRGDDAPCGRTLEALSMTA